MSTRISSRGGRSAREFLNYLPTIIGLIVALSWPFWISPLLDLLFPTVAENPYLGHAGSWLAAGILLGIVLVWERQPMSSIGFRQPSWQNILWGFGCFVIGILTFIITNPIVRALHLTTVGGTISQQINQIPVRVGLFVAFTAGVTEEILYRGYPIERFSKVTGHLAWGAILSYFAFVLMHLPFWGLGGMIQIGIWAVIPTVLYAKRRNLYANILMHFLNDTFAPVLMSLLLARYLR